MRYYYTGEYIQLGDENAEGDRYFFINNNTALKMGRSRIKYNIKAKIKKKNMKRFFLYYGNVCIYFAISSNL